MRGAGALVCGACACSCRIALASCGNLLAVDDAAVVDGGGDGGSGSADGGGGDGGGDGGAGEGGPSACEGAPLFCDDFETGLGKWSTAEGAVALEPRATGGTACVASVPSGVAAARSRVLSPVGAAQSRIRLSFEVVVDDPRYPSVNTSANFAIAALAVPGVDSRVSLYVAPNASSVLDLEATAQKTGGVFAGSTGARAAFTPGLWHTVVLDVTFGAGSGSYSVTLDGAPLDTGVPVDLGTGPTQLELGLQRTNEATPALLARFDNVRMESLP